ncbi:TIGR01244 family phosphatase [Acetobacter sp. LMG 1627]|uniref:TIGR01244 family phosphatase n=1 Tax=Acetobacter conturbans TaxID=1737472 RepID=A0ABX0JZV1_9PROT|nr:bifunctional protein tyrosine phosphatase family protein/NAD(P)/FAD-dependent oxidoreductase [Acetobacter conturbans]NHN88530.1 TIGR01244 family phosphatase [Acetobacter conturbans]
MTPRYLTNSFAVTSQLSVEDIAEAGRQGFRGIICARPDAEETGQPTAAALELAAVEAGLTFEMIPVRTGTLPESTDIDRARVTLKGVDGPVLGYCRSGNRAGQLWALAMADSLAADQILAAGRQAGLDFSPLTTHQQHASATRAPAAGSSMRRFDVVVIGGGAGGLAAASGMLRRRPRTSVAVVEPSEEHFYQPGWTLVGGGIFRSAQTRRAEASVMPKDADWVKARVERVFPDDRQVLLSDGTTLFYEILIVAAGITLNWAGIDGLSETLGRNGVTSNYRYDLAPYTWELVQSMKGGNAIFTQPPMPIKCAGAPQKAMYLACDAWRRKGILNQINVEFDNAGGVLFGVPEFVPALMEYVRTYGIGLEFSSRLTAVNGTRKVATFERKTEAGIEQVERPFDMLHVVPPQIAPSFIRESGLSDDSGFVAVDPGTLRHKSYPTIFAIGDSAGTGNAKTAAAVRKQAPVVALNAIAALDGKPPVATYDGYGGCPLTVENGKIVLAEFGYGGKLLPTLPKWLLDGTHPSRLAWYLKKDVMPLLYWEMLKGREVMVQPTKISRG